MKAAVFAIALFTAIGAVAQPAKTDYSGKWTLDLAASKNLPRLYNELESGGINVTQTEKQFTVVVALHSKNPQRPDFNQTYVYNLDGTPTQTEVPVRGPNGAVNVPTTLTGGYDKGLLELKIASKFGEREMMMVEHWSLSEDGKTLTVHRNDAGPMGQMEFDIVFRRA